VPLIARFGAGHLFGAGSIAGAAESSSLAWQWEVVIELGMGSTASADVVAVNPSYGTDPGSDSPRAGSMSITLRNNDGRYTPQGTGTHSTETWFGRRAYVRAFDVLADYGDAGPPVLFDGVVTDVLFDFPSHLEGTVEVVVTDRLGVIYAQGFEIDGTGNNGAGSSTTLAADTVEAWLDAAVAEANPDELPAQTAVNMLTGASTPTHADLVFSGNGGELVSKLAHTEAGTITCRHGVRPAGYASTEPGEIWLRPRGEPPLDPSVVFSDDGTPGEFPFTEPQFTFAGSDLVTSYKLTREGGVEQTGVNTGAARGIDRQVSRSGLFNATDTDVNAVGQRIVSLRGRPLFRINQLRTVPFREGDASVEALLGLSTLDRVTVRLTTAGAASATTYEAVISGVSWQLTPEVCQGTFDLVDISDYVAFILDSADFGELDVNKLG
jgi:hypothetical protein